MSYTLKNIAWIPLNATAKSLLFSDLKNAAWGTSDSIMDASSAIRGLEIPWDQAYLQVSLGM